MSSNAPLRRSRAGSRGPTPHRTLIHFDFRADNLLFGTTDAADPVVVVDFQAMTTGLGATDLAYLIGGSVADRSTRAAVEADLLERYRRRLAALGARAECGHAVA